LVFKL